jgi:hypothetical protein
MTGNFVGRNSSVLLALSEAKGASKGFDITALG